MPTTVAIIGGGPAGLTSAKAAVECGLCPTVFEKRPLPGGVWSLGYGNAWNSMHTNASRFQMMFCDFPHKETTDDFPHNRDLHQYLCDYAKHYNVYDCIKLNCTVERVEKCDDKRWKVQWTKDGSPTQSDYFDLVIVATGFYTFPFMPAYEGVEKFKGKILHSAQYRTPEMFKNENVVVVGNSFSGSEIAADVSTTAANVVHVFKRPYWILPRWISGNVPDHKLPWDVMYHSRCIPAKNVTLDEEIALENNKWLAKHQDVQQSQYPELEMKLDYQEPCNYFTLSDSYLPKYKEKKFTVKISSVKRIQEDGVVFDDGTFAKADTIICATGYRTKFPFLGKQILGDIGYDEESFWHPVLLHKTVFPKNTPGLAFVGLVNPPFFAFLEIQAKWACMVFSGKAKMPSKEEIETGIRNEQKIRNTQSQFTYMNVPQFCDDIGIEIGLQIDFEKLKVENPKLYKKLWYGPFSLAYYYLNGSPASGNREKAMKHLDHMWKFANVTDA